MALSPEFCLRRAEPTDAWAIRRLVFSAWLDPTQIRWQQFWVITTQDKVIGCGQLRRFGDTQELGSLVIASQWRQQGLGTELAKHLINQADQPLYVECLGDRLFHFYHRLGFVNADWNTMPPTIRKKFQTTRWLARVLPVPLHVLVYAQPK